MPSAAVETLTDLFISYAREDQEFVRVLESELSEAGFEVWVDWQDIPPTADWFDRIRAGILDAHTMVFIVGPDSLSSEVCARELEVAGSHNLRIVPILHRDPGDRAIPELVGRHNWIFFDSDSDHATALATLVEALNTDLDWVTEHAAWEQLAHRWESSGRDSSALLRGSDLDSAEQFLRRASSESKRPEPTGLVTEHVLASREAARRRARIAAVAGAAVLMVTAVLAVFALIQRNTARDQRADAVSRALAASAFQQLESDPEMSILLADRALDEAETTEATDALRRGLVASRAELSVATPGIGMTAAAVSPDGSLIATAGERGQAMIWDAETGEQLDVLVHQREEREGAPTVSLTRVEFSPDGRSLLTAGESLRTKIWDVESGKVRVDLVDEDYRQALSAFSPNGELVVTGSFLGQLRIWSAESGREHDALPAYSPTAAGFSPDGKSLVAAARPCVGSEGCPVYPALYSGGNWSKALEWPNERQAYFSTVEFSDDGAIFVVAGGDSAGDESQPGRAWIHRTSDGKQLGSITRRGAILDAAISPDGRLLALAGTDGVATTYETRGGQSVATLSGHDGRVSEVEFSGGGDLLVTSSDDGTSRIWEPRTGVEVGRLLGHSGPVRSLTVLPGERPLVLTAGSDGTARIWDATRAGPMFAATGDPVGFSGAAFDAALGSEHRRLAVPGGGDVALLDLLDGGQVGSVDAAEAGENASMVAFTDAASAVLFAAGPGGYSLDGSRFAAVNEEGTVQVGGSTGSLDTVSDDDPVLGEVEPAATGDVALDQRGDRVAAAVGTEIVVWDGRTGEELQRLAAFDPLPERFSPSLNSLALSADGSLVAGRALWDETVRVWDVDRGEVVSELAGGAGFSPTDVDLSPDLAFIATTATDNSLRIFDRSSGVLLSTLPFDGPEGGFGTKVGFVGGKPAIVVVTDRQINRFDCRVCVGTDELRELSGERATRELSAVERERYLGGLDD